MYPLDPTLFNATYFSDDLYMWLLFLNQVLGMHDYAIIIQTSF